MNRQVKRYAIISDNWDYVESPTGGFVDRDDYAALEAECDSLWSTYVALVDKLGIDTEKAKTADGKPSDVILSYIDKLRAENDRLRKASEAIREFEKSGWHGGRGYHAGLLKAAQIVDELEKLATSAVQSAPAGEREAYEQWKANMQPYGFNGADAFQAGAAWQRLQSAGVPEGWRLVPVNLTKEQIAADPYGMGYGRLHAVWRALLAAAPAQPAAQEQHPDDEAVDRFAVAMKAKLAKSREKGRRGWQTASAAHLSGLLYRHMYKADPLDVANLAMMLHQNGQAIELPHEARHDQGEVLTEHSGCGRGIQVDQLTVRMYPGDKVVMVRGRIGKALTASTEQEVEK